MKPDFALNLSHDGIGLLQRRGDGWILLEELSLDTPDLPERLAAMRARAEDLAPQGLLTKLVIPASQILYTRVEAPGPSPAARRKQIATALEGLTPYPVENLVFDWSGTGTEVAVAVVARDTLTEAETFAQTYGFAPVAFCAIPDERDFPAEVWFGLASSAAALLPDGERILRDTQIMRIVSAEEAPPLAEPAEEDTPAKAPTDEVPPAPIADAHQPEAADPEPAAAEPLPEAETPAPAVIDATLEQEASGAALAETDQAEPPPATLGSKAEADAPQKTDEGSAAPEPDTSPAAPAESAEQAAVDAAVSAAIAEIEAPDTPTAAPAPAPRLGGVQREPEKTAAPALAKTKTTASDAVELVKAASGKLEKAGATARKLGKEAGAAGGAALQAASARLKAARAKPETPPETQPTEQASVTAFGTPKNRIGGKPRHLGIALVGGLAAMLVLVGVWANFLETPPAAPSVEPPPAEEQLAAAPPQEATAEPAPAPALTEQSPAPEAVAPVTQEPPVSVVPEATPAPEPPPAPITGLASSEPEPAPPPATLPALPPNTLPPLTVARAESAAPAPEPQPAPEPVLEPTPEGTLSPEGFTLVAGRPDRVPGPRPAAVLAAYSAANAPYADPALKGLRPRPRPASVTRAFEASQQAPAAIEPAAPDTTPEEDHSALPYADPALADARPKPRPASVLEAARLATTPPPIANPAAARLASVRPRARPASILTAASDAQAQVAAEAAAAALASRPDPFESATGLAVTVSRRPAPKPSTIAAIAANARRDEVAAAKTAKPEPTAAASKFPTNASVAKRATVRNGMDLGEMNLIGLFGSSKSRRALIRMPNGKFVKVGVGDKLDGGKVTAIGTDTISYTKKSRSYTLKLLKGS